MPTSTSLSRPDGPDRGGRPSARRWTSAGPRTSLPASAPTTALVGTAYRLLADHPHLGEPGGAALQLHRLEPLVDAEPAGPVVDQQRGRQHLGSHVVDVT